MTPPFRRKVFLSAATEIIMVASQLLANGLIRLWYAGVIVLTLLAVATVAGVAVGFRALLNL